MVRFVKAHTTIRAACYDEAMKGVTYLVNDEGEKTHVVLDLRVWREAWQTLQTHYAKEMPEESLAKARQPGFLNNLLEKAGMPTAEGVGDSLLEPMSEEELKEWYDNPIFPDEPSS